MNRTTTHGFKAFELLKGIGIEIGALSSPFDLEARVIYADITDANTMAEQLSRNEGKGYLSNPLVEVGLIIEPPFFNFKGLEPESHDFCVSSNVVEHHPNPIYFLLEQFRVIKKGGILYAAIPNKERTYDRGRLTTPINHLEKKFIDFDFSDDYIFALDIVKNTLSHKDYEGKGDEMATHLTNNRDGHHHFYTYNPESVFELIACLSKYQKFRFEYYNLDGMNIHFALRKA